MTLLRWKIRFTCVLSVVLVGQSEGRLVIKVGKPVLHIKELPGNNYTSGLKAKYFASFLVERVVCMLSVVCQSVGWFVIKVGIPR